MRLPQTASMQRINSDVVIALLLLLVCAVSFAETFAYQKVHLAIIGSKLWPRVVVVVLFALSSVYLIQALRQQRPARAEPWSFSQWLSANRNVIGCFALYALFLLTLPYFGMLLGGALFVFLTLTFLGRHDLRSHLWHIVIAIAAVGLMWVVFTYALGVILPEGEILPR